MTMFQLIELEFGPRDAYIKCDGKRTDEHVSQTKPLRHCPVL